MSETESSSEERSYSKSPGSDKKEKSFTYRFEIENLDLTEGEKNKLRKLCKKVEQSFELSESQLEKISRFDIKNVGDLNCQYTLDRGLCRRDIGEQPNNTSAFTPEETGIIEDNYNRFCEEYGFHKREDVNVFLPTTFGRRNGRHSLSREQLRVFCCYLSQNLRNRPPRSVYAKFVKIYYYYRSGQFSREEDELLKSWYDLNPGKCIYAILGRILHRSRLLVRRRVMRLLGKGLVREKSRENSRVAETPSYVEDIVNRESDLYPNWTKNEEAWKKMNSNNQDVKELKKTYFREIYPSARASKKVTSRVFKLTLLKLLSALEDPTWDNVDWVRLGEKCYNVGAVRAYSVVRTLTKKYVPKNDWGDLAVAIRTIKEKNPALLDYAKKYLASVKENDVSSNSEDDSCMMIRRKLLRSMRKEVDDSVIVTSPRKKRRRAKLLEGEEIENKTGQYNSKDDGEYVTSTTADSPSVDDSIIVTSPRSKRRRAKVQEGEEVDNETGQNNSKDDGEDVTTIRDDSPSVDDSIIVTSPWKKRRRAKVQEGEEIENKTGQNNSKGDGEDVTIITADSPLLMTQ